jgi:large subunit ribosomal protein L29
MQANEIRGLQTQEILDKVELAREDLFRLRMKLATGQQKDTTQMKVVRRLIARYLTVLRERELRDQLKAAQTAKEV